VPVPALQRCGTDLSDAAEHRAGWRLMMCMMCTIRHMVAEVRW